MFDKVTPIVLIHQVSKYLQITFSEGPVTHRLIDQRLTDLKI